MKTYHSFEELPSQTETEDQKKADYSQQVATEREQPARCKRGSKVLYPRYTRKKHPRGPWDVARWVCSFDAWRHGYGTKYCGPYAERTDELQRLHDSFIHDYIRKRNLHEWKSADGSEIKNPLVDVLDAFDEWRANELAKPPEERACAFSEDGFPEKCGHFAAFLDAATKSAKCYFEGNPLAISRYYDKLAIRGLVPDRRNVRSEDPSRAFSHGLWRKIPGIDNDVELLPPDIVADLLKTQRTFGVTLLESASHNQDERKKEPSITMTPDFQDNYINYSHSFIRDEDETSPRRIVGMDSEVRKVKIREYVTGCFENSHWNPKNKMQVAYCFAMYLREDDSESALNTVSEIEQADDSFFDYYISRGKDLEREAGNDNISSAVSHVKRTFWHWDCAPSRHRTVERVDLGSAPTTGDKNKAISLVASSFAATPIDSKRLYDEYDMLAFRGLVPDFSGVMKLDWAAAYERGFHKNVFALKEDAKLLPPEFVEYVLERKRREGLPAELDGETGRHIQTFLEIDKLRKRKTATFEQERKRHPIYYKPSVHAYERLKPVETLEGKRLTKALERLNEDRNAQAEFAIGMPADFYTFFSQSHHPTNPYHFAFWHVRNFMIDDNRLIYGGPEPERAAGLGLLCDEFIDWYFQMMDACKWSEEDGSPILRPLSHVLDSFDYWRTGPGQNLIGEDGFPRELGKYNDYLYMAWRTMPWNFRKKKIRSKRNDAYDQLAIRELAPFFAEETKKVLENEGLKEISPAITYRTVPFKSEEERKYKVGFPLPYADFTPDHHPTSPMHIAVWRTRYLRHAYSNGNCFGYEGPYASRTSEFTRMPYTFIEEYLRKMDDLGWKNEDGSRIADALKHILDSFDDWRKRELAKPPEERVCEFGEDEFPITYGKALPFYLAADDCVEDTAWGSTGSRKASVMRYNALAFRGLVWDADGVRELPLETILHYPFLYARLDGIDNDEELFPKEYAKQLILRRESEEKME